MLGGDSGISDALLNRVATLLVFAGASYSKRMSSCTLIGAIVE